MTIDDKVFAALRNGPLSTYDLAKKLWPPKECPRAWNYQSNGGPPGWVLTLGKVIKKHRLHTWMDGRKKMVSHRTI